MKAKILIICTGNSCRSQIAEAYLSKFDKEMTVRSAGTVPAKCVNPYAVKVLQEDGIDISDRTPHDIREYLDETWDYVITVCGGAKENCPAFFGHVSQQLHMGFDDPTEASDTEKLQVFRRVRDEIKSRFQTFYNHINMAHDGSKETV
jgi:arsenate reductase